MKEEDIKTTIFRDILVEKVLGTSNQRIFAYNFIVFVLETIYN